MLVYGDHSVIADARERLRSLAEQIGTVASLPAGIGRHAKLVGALIEAGQLLQGVADAEFEASDLNDLVRDLAVAVVRSYDSRCAERPLPDVQQLDLPSRIELRLPEGFAFYAVYPESYIEAARRLRLIGPPRVIGIRSIGTTLGAIVAAALNAPPAITVRPFGDPFARQVELPAELADDGSHYVIVDEGPGLSGSSFGSVADQLEARGLPMERIAFLPSHGDDLGPRASEAHRRRWHRAQRVAAEFDPRFLRNVFGRLEKFAIGSPWERRKFFASRNGERLLLKFAGLGAIGERKLEMARALYAAGLTPEPLGLAHGFLLERWCGDARPLDANEKPVVQIGRYIGTRARMFSADESSGASIEQLLTMCRRNISLAFGDEAARTVAAPRQTARARRVRTDNKLDREEWLRTADGRLLKTDVLDHHQSHDLIGCQPVEWDFAGAILEFDLDESEADRMIGSSGCAVDRLLLDFYRLAYAVFRLGQAHVAAELAGCTSERFEQNTARYRRAVELLLDESACRGESARILV